MTCLECNEPMKERTNQTMAYTMGGLPHVTVRGITIRQCRNGHQETVIPKIDALHRSIASTLIRKAERLAPEEIRFLRKYLGYSQADFAAVAGVAPESANRWESGKVQMAVASERLLRLMVARQAPIEDYTLEDLQRANTIPVVVTSTVTAKMKDGETWILSTHAA